MTHCVPSILVCSDGHSEERAAVPMLDIRQRDNHSLVPNTASNGSTACVPEAPTETHIAKQMDTLTITNCTIKNCGTIFPSFYLDVIAEPTAEDLGSSDCFSAQSRAAMEEFQVERRSVGKRGVKGMEQGGEPYGGEQYEKGVASHRDGIFQKFYKRISSCPSQGLRCVYIRTTHITLYIQYVCTACACSLTCTRIQYAV